MVSRRSMTFLTLKLLKLTVGAIACVEVILFSFTMSTIMRRLALDWPDRPNHWFLLYMVFIIGLYMALPIAMGLLVAKSKIKPNNNSLLWFLFILPARLATLTFLAVKLAAFHYVMIPHILSIIALTAYYAFAFRAKLRLKKDKLKQIFGGHQIEVVQKNVDGTPLPPPVMIGEIQVLDVNGLNGRKGSAVHKSSYIDTI